MLSRGDSLAAAYGRTKEPKLLQMKNARLSLSFEYQTFPSAQQVRDGTDGYINRASGTEHLPSKWIWVSPAESEKKLRNHQGQVDGLLSSGMWALTIYQRCYGPFRAAFGIDLASKGRPQSNEIYVNRWTRSKFETWKPKITTFFGAPETGA